MSVIFNEWEKLKGVKLASYLKERSWQRAREDQSELMRAAAKEIERLAVRRKK
jgi:hypothetical protein